MSAQISNSMWQEGSELIAPPPEPLPQANIPALFFDRLRGRESKPFCRFRESVRGAIRTVTWGETGTQVSALALFLRDTLHLQFQDRVAILSATRFEWVIADLAILSVGAISTPIYQTSTPAEVGFILWDSGAEIVFVENEEQFEKLLRLTADVVDVPGSEDVPGGSVRLSIRAVLSFEPVTRREGGPEVYYLGDILSKPLPAHSTSILSGLLQIGRQDLAAIVYTSGTTGIFKGVMQSHENHLAMLDAVLLSGLLGDAEGIFLYLPLAHSFARLIAYSAIAGGGSLLFPTVASRERSVFNSNLLFHDVRQLEPQFFPSVPRIFEKLMNNLTASPKRSLRARIVRKAINDFQRLHPKQLEGELRGTIDRLHYALSRAIVEKVRTTVFGKRFSYAISGGAPCSIEVLRFFHSIGVMIYQGYGLTETTPAISANTVRMNRFGTVGRPFACCEVKIAEEDGEILVRGRNVAKGYWRRPRATAEVWRKDGWFCTGDIGTLDGEGFLTITDRKKELIVSAGGKKVAPAFLEGRLKSSAFISQAFVFGERKPYLVALLTLELPSVRGWASEHGVIVSDDRDFATHPKVVELLEKEVKRFNQDLSSYEQVKRFALLSEDFSVDNGLLTPTLKLRRKVIEERYRELIEGLYRGKGDL